MKNNGWRRLRRAALFALSAVMIRMSPASFPVSGEEAGAEQAPFSYTQAQIAEIAAYPDAFVTAAESGRLRLEVNKKQARVRLLDKETGVLWNSSPESYEEDELARGVAQAEMGSLLIIKYAHRDSSLITKNSKTNSVGKKGALVTSLPNGVRIDFYFPQEQFRIPVLLTVEGEVFRATILTGEIVETGSKFRLASVELLPYFGAASTQDSGYSFVPDGCGAIIGHNTPSGGYSGYSEMVYGDEKAVMKDVKPQDAGHISMPVFGMKKNGAAFLGMIEQGDEKAKINASVSGAKNSYNAVGAEFVYRQTESIPVQTNNNMGWLNITEFEPEPVRDAFTVGYRFLAEDQADYSGMAGLYREYLTENGGLKKSAYAGGNPLYVEILGGVERQESAFGIPVKRVMPVTRFEDIREITRSLRESGVVEIVYNYTFWERGANNQAVYEKPSPEGRLGGESGLRAMLDGAQSDGVRMVLDLNLITMCRSTWGYSRQYDAVQSIRQEPVIDYPYRVNTQAIDRSVPLRFLLHPRRAASLAEKLAGNLGDVSAAGYSLGGIGTVLYSDFADNAVSRIETRRLWQAAAGTIAGEAPLLLRKPDAYLWQAASEITGAPAESQHHLLFTADVPFYQMVLRGAVPLSVPAANSYADRDDPFLKALETGSQLLYRWGARGLDQLPSTALGQYAYLDYRQWVREAGERYNELSAVNRLVAGERIARHDLFGGGVARTTYENGVCVYVNYGNEAAHVDGQEIPAKGYAVGGAENEQG